MPNIDDYPAYMQAFLNNLEEFEQANRPSSPFSPLREELETIHKLYQHTISVLEKRANGALFIETDHRTRGWRTTCIRRYRESLSQVVFFRVLAILRNQTPPPDWTSVSASISDVYLQIFDILRTDQQHLQQNPQDPSLGDLQNNLHTILGRCSHEYADTITTIFNNHLANCQGSAIFPDLFRQAVDSIQIQQNTASQDFKTELSRLIQANPIDQHTIISKDVLFRIAVTRRNSQVLNAFTDSQRTGFTQMITTIAQQQIPPPQPQPDPHAHLTSILQARDATISARDQAEAARASAITAQIGASTARQQVEAMLHNPIDPSPRKDPASTEILQARDAAMSAQEKAEVAKASAIAARNGASNARQQVVEILQHPIGPLLRGPFGKKAAVALGGGLILGGYLLTYFVTKQNNSETQLKNVLTELETLKKDLKSSEIKIEELSAEIKILKKPPDAKEEPLLSEPRTMMEWIKSNFS